MVQETEHTFNLLIVGVLLLIDAFQTLLSIPTRGIFIDQREVLLTKSNKELKAMLVGVKKVTKNNNFEQLLGVFVDPWLMCS